MPRIALIIALGVLSSGCVAAIKQSEVDSALRGAGFTVDDARCASLRAARRLSVSELRSLQRVTTRVNQPVREMKVGELYDAVMDNVDPATIGTIARIGAECAQQRQQRAARQ